MGLVETKEDRYLPGMTDLTHIIAGLSLYKYTSHCRTFRTLSILPNPLA